MGATSVSGVGPGSADGHNKGSEHMTLGVNKLIGPHIVAAGTVTLSGGTKTITFPQSLSASKTSHVVMLTVTSASTTVARVTTKTDDSNSLFASFVITGGTTDTVDYLVAFTG